MDKEKAKEYSRNYVLRHPERRKASVLKYDSAHKEEKRERSRRRYALNKKSEKARSVAWQKIQYATNLNFRLQACLRTNFRSAIKRNWKSGKALGLLGCSIDEFKAWVSGWFEPGMSWDNYGQWHIDHHRPCASFDLCDPNQQQRCFHYLNMRPMWALDNIRKGAKWQ